MVDTSALVAIIGGEPEAGAFKWEMSLARRIAMSAGTAIEVFIVVRARWGQEGIDRLETLLSELKVELRDVEQTHIRLAAGAFERFGRGSGSRAKLNYGDCFSYALARSLDAPLLFKGDDFVHTDLVSALPAT